MKDHLTLCCPVLICPNIARTPSDILLHIRMYKYIPTYELIQFKFMKRVSEIFCLED